MYYLVYKVVNKVNGKYYIGAHKTEDKNDDYKGSGKAIRRAHLKYGLENFTKEILFECNSEEEMYLKEKEIVTEDVVKDRMSYNLKPGGEANFYYINRNGLNHSSNQHLKLRDHLKADPEYAKQFSEKMKNIGKENGKKISKKFKGRFWIHNPLTHQNRFVDKDIGTELFLKGWEKGFDTTNSPAYGKGPLGKIWIYNETTHENKLILKTETIPQGWKKGCFKSK